MFYGIDANFWGLTNPAFASEMHVPQKYYVASRIREAYRPRLEAAGLWSLPAAEEEPKGLFEKDKKKKKRDYTVTFSRAFEREKVGDELCWRSSTYCWSRSWIKQRRRLGCMQAT